MGQEFFACQAATAQARLELADALVEQKKALVEAQLALQEQAQMAVDKATGAPPNDEDDDMDLGAKSPAQSTSGVTDVVGALAV